MKLSVPSRLAAALMTLVSAAAAHGYESGDWIWRASMMEQAPVSGSDEFDTGYPGGNLKFGAELMPALQFDYFVLDGLSLGASMPVMTLNQNLFVETDTGSQRIGRVDVLPLTFSLNWYLPKVSNIRTYLIGAWQYALVISDKVRSDPVSGLEKLEADNGSGFGAGIGIEWDRDSHWSWNASAVKFSQSQDVRVSFSGNKTTLDAQPDPLVLNLGIARRF